MGEGGGGMAWGGVEKSVAEAYAKYAEHTVTLFPPKSLKHMRALSALCGVA
jgi:hypothetical protein